LLEKQVIAKATTARMEEEAFAMKHGALRVANDKLKRKKARNTLKLLNKSARRRRSSPFSRPIVLTLVKRLCALHTPSATFNRLDR